MGYAGGTTTDPNYYRLYDHSEAIQIDYDPAVVSYEQLLRTFWISHYPNYEQSVVQYKSIIFYHDEEQRQLAERTKAEREAEIGEQVYTEIRPYSAFYLAEDYHQKYYLRSNLKDITKELHAIYPDEKDFVNSTAVARVNGFAAGYGTVETLMKEIGSYGLSEAAQQELLKYADRPLVPGCPLPPVAGLK